MKLELEPWKAKERNMMAFFPDDKTFVMECTLVHETEKALLVEGKSVVRGLAGGQRWIPKSAIKRRSG